jgi:peptide/nickel transport system substrate-binding protein
VLRVETRATATDLNSPVRPLIYENLIRLDDRGAPQPQLAARWETQNGYRRWQFWLQPGIRFHDDAPLDAAAVVASLAWQCPDSHPAAAPEEPALSGAKGPGAPSCEWTALRAAGESVVFDFAEPRPRFAQELAQTRYAIQHPGDNVPPAGTGPYRWSEARGNTRVLQANEDYWGGRPFADRIELLPSRNVRDQAADLALGRADIVEAGPGQLRRLAKERTAVSLPFTLLAVVVRPAKPALQDVRLREALALAIDRAAIHKVVLQNSGEVAGGLLPNWLSGYAFLFAQSGDLARAKQLAQELGSAPVLAIAAAGSDPELQLIGERIALNAHDVGLVVQSVTNPQQADLLVTQTDLASLDPAVALAALAESFGERLNGRAASPQQLYEEEHALVSQGYVIPLAYVPRICALGPRVRNWTVAPDGRWPLEQVWLAPGEAAP